MICLLLHFHHLLLNKRISESTQNINKKVYNSLKYVEDANFVCGIKNNNNNKK